MFRWRFWLSQGLWSMFLVATFIGASESFGIQPLWLLIPLTMAFLISGFVQKWGEPSHSQRDNSHLLITLFRIGGTGMIWLSYLVGAMYALETVGAWAIIFSFILMIPLIVISAVMWGVLERGKSQPQQSQESLEKRKRDRLDAVLRDLSDDDLARLRKRLSTGSVSEDDLQYLLSEDGELLLDERER